MEAGNRFDDFELDDPKAMRALAHPVRLAILVRLQRHGPSTASRLAPHVGATASVTSWHLRHLAGFGLVRDAAGGTDRRERCWAATAGGFRISAGTDDESRSAARALSRQLFRHVGDLPDRWAAEVEPDLEPQWRDRSGVASTRIVVSPEELDAVNDAIEQILAPYVQRKRGVAPAGTRGVRLLRYQLAEAEDEGSGGAEVGAEGVAPDLAAGGSQSAAAGDGRDGGES